MSITTVVSAISSNRFVVPCAGKMFRSNISKSDKALSFVLNKGYFETYDLKSMLSIIDDIEDFNDLILVGKIEKVRLTKNKDIVYRQRIFFKSLFILVKFCKSYGIRFELGKDFKITINNILNCTEDLVYLERYAKRFDESIDVWLTHCCIIELHYYLLSLNVYSNLKNKVNNFLYGKINYLNRAPFLVSSYSIDNKKSGIFLDFDLNDERLFKDINNKFDLLKEGYTMKNIEKDKKDGKFK